MRSSIVTALIEVHKTTSNLDHSTVGLDLFAARLCKDGVLTNADLKDFLRATTRHQEKAA